MTCANPSAPAQLQRLGMWLDEIPRTGSWHMAADELLLALASQPVLRIYIWAQHEVSGGYGQSADEIRAFAGNRPWVRRWTAGGLVEHGGDVTICLALPSSEPTSHLRSASLYEFIHQAALRALRAHFPDIHRARPESLSYGGVCFSNPVCGDLMADDQKVLGGALRRTRAGTLYQGSLQVTLDARAFALALAKELAVNVFPWTPDRGVHDAIEQLQRIRYDSEAWALRR